jgi:hypothetical protein
MSSLSSSFWRFSSTIFRSSAELWTLVIADLLLQRLVAAFQLRKMRLYGNRCVSF